MINSKSDYKPLFTTILLIVAGLVSPSNGVDDKKNKSATEILVEVIFVIVAVTLIYLITSLIISYKNSIESDSSEEKINF
ncbi:MAG: hypothetical protein U0W65_15940 [Bacteroidia bacterium]|nr:hypothetical protein [Bacteroidia bacterium]